MSKKAILILQERKVEKQRTKRWGDVNNVSMVLELRMMNDDVLANGLTAYNQMYTIYFEGSSVTGEGGSRHLECTVSSPDGTSLVYNEISYY